MVIANGSPNGVPVVHIAGREISNGIAGRTAYSMTGVVRAARIAAQEHFPSDVVDGGPIGWFFM
jgi:hypothetical protein